MKIVLTSLMVTALLAGCGYDDDTGDGSLLNGDFDSNTSNWAVEDAGSATLAWSPLDANNSSSSGSILITNTSVGASNGSGVIQCVTGITAGASYTFGGKVLFPTGQARTGELQIGLRWRDGANCTGNVLGSQPRVSMNTPGAAWVPLVSGTLVAPSGTVSADFIAFPTKIEAGGTLVGNFDDLTIQKVGGYLILAPGR